MRRRKRMRMGDLPTVPGGLFGYSHRLLRLHDEHRLFGSQLRVVQHPGMHGASEWVYGRDL